ncbi:MAG: hypothetical protein J0H30_11680, partial [Alphaproteobacteria bacterium]|nr:hypothetical protein [Alphaproteobacteria bacterium]
AQRRHVQRIERRGQAFLRQLADTRAQLAFLKSKLIDDPQAEQYRPKLIEVAPGHFVAEHDAA